MSIPFSTKHVNTDDLAKGKTQVKTEGVKGLKLVTYSDGKVIKTEVLREPVTEVILVGTHVEKRQPTAHVTVCEVRTSGDASMAVVKAVVFDPDNVGYTVTLHINGRTVKSPPDSGDSQFSTQIQGATKAYGCSVSLS